MRVLCAISGVAAAAAVMSTVGGGNGSEDGNENGSNNGNGESRINSPGNLSHPGKGNHDGTGGNYHKIIFTIKEDGKDEEENTEAHHDNESSSNGYGNSSNSTVNWRNESISSDRNSSSHNSGSSHNSHYFINNADLANPIFQHANLGPPIAPSSGPIPSHPIPVIGAPMINMEGRMLMSNDPRNQQSQYNSHGALSTSADHSNSSSASASVASSYGFGSVSSMGTIAHVVSPSSIPISPLARPFTVDTSNCTNNPIFFQRFASSPPQPNSNAKSNNNEGADCGSSGGDSRSQGSNSCFNDLSYFSKTKKDHWMPNNQKTNAHASNDDDDDIGEDEDKIREELPFTFYPHRPPTTPRFSPQGLNQRTAGDSSNNNDTSSDFAAAKGFTTDGVDPTEAPSHALPPPEWPAVPPLHAAVDQDPIYEHNTEASESRNEEGCTKSLQATLRPSDSTAGAEASSSLPASERKVPISIPTEDESSFFPMAEGEASMPLSPIPNSISDAVRRRLELLQARQSKVVDFERGGEEGRRDDKGQAAEAKPEESVEVHGGRSVDGEKEGKQEEEVTEATDDKKADVRIQESSVFLEAEMEMTGDFSSTHNTQGIVMVEELDPLAIEAIEAAKEAEEVINAQKAMNKKKQKRGIWGWMSGQQR
eukprot:CAMPEP_0175086196 /NCGR_PEP_ID=MMETSP0052_2-20121109/29101_1 /TAXON_ID=51329 ORGANISM="Polytomella parva, Strain SAG 63-3" /NCGR_SAMPLE_ID=MMETSP0052_2 /ASSEMBLY_ACC=CAM_ASM_000194 /LENGTH=650 /DNA_ID=CAMNT_0016358325 /DNA_START=153 /DNA_END=2105 /DNA_ORIENTATION=-